MRPDGIDQLRFGVPLTWAFDQQWTLFAVPTLRYYGESGADAGDSATGAALSYAEMMHLPLLIALLLALAGVGGGVAVSCRRRVAPRLDDPPRGTGYRAVDDRRDHHGPLGQWSFVAKDSHPMGGMEFEVVLLLMGVCFFGRTVRLAEHGRLAAIGEERNGTLPTPLP